MKLKDIDSYGPRDCRSRYAIFTKLLHKQCNPAALTKDSADILIILTA